MASINPLEFFSVGQSIGRTNAPTRGIAGAVRSVLERAKSMGLVQAQAQAQGQEARATAQFKSGLQSPEVPLKIVQSSGEVLDRGTVPRGSVVKSAPAPNIFTALGNIDNAAAPSESPNPLTKERVTPGDGISPDELQAIRTLIQQKRGE